MHCLQQVRKIAAHAIADIVQIIEGQLFRALIISFFRYDIVNPPGEFIGLENYKSAFSSQYYWEAWKNTFVFLILQLALCAHSGTFIK